MRNIALLALCWLAFATRSLAAGYAFDYNGRCQQAYQAYLSFRINEGDELIRKELAANPGNLMAVYLSDYGDFFSLMFQGSREELKRRRPYQDKRLDLIDKASDNDPWKDFARSGIYFHWSLIHGWYGDQLKAATLLRKSYLTLKDNTNRFPTFAPNNMLLGVEEAVTGTIPDEYKWVASVLGMKGSVTNGINRLSRFLATQRNGPLYSEAFAYNIYLRFYLLSQRDEVWKIVSDSSFPSRGNLFHLFIKANIALNYHRADAALQTLREAAALPGYSQIPSFDYEMGNALFHKLDASCLTYFNRFLTNNRAGTYSKDALMKSALMYYLQGNQAKAAELRNRIAGTGNTTTDADKQAQRFREEGNWPNPLLLQARILIDGGLYNQALAKLHQLDPATMPDPGDRLEYAYRTGRAFEETDDIPKAIRFYQSAINTGRDRKEQFAARSALQLALIYESRGQNTEALRFFRLCLSMKHHDFQASIDQQAKAGVNRLTM